MSGAEISIPEREANERAVFEAVGSNGRSAYSDAELVLPPSTFDQYAAVAEGRRAVIEPLEQMIAWSAPLAGRRVLEICCHDGEYGAILAHLGAEVEGIDIAASLVNLANRRASLNGVSHRMHARVMSAHAIQFPAESFDLVFGKAALHHLDLDAARREIRRVLRPGGIGVFAEPVVLSEAARTLRRRAPVQSARETLYERQLSAEELDRFCEGFPEQRRAYFRLLSRLDRVMPQAKGWLDRIDRFVLSGVPRLRQWAGICVLAVRKPATG